MTWRHKKPGRQQATIVSTQFSQNVHWSRCQKGLGAWTKRSIFCARHIRSSFLGFVHVHDIMTSSNGNIFRVTGPLCGEFTGDRWIPLTKAHSVESPSMVDPQWDIWYWGSKRNLHTVCWSAVGCEWGTTSVYFGITYVCLIPSRLPTLLLSPSTYFKIFYFCQKYHLKDTYKIFKKFHVGLKLEWGL